MAPKRISILGVGLLGGSIGLAVKQRLSNCKIVGYAHRSATLAAALEAGAIDEGHETLAPAVHGADLVILCTPVGLFRPLLSELATHLEPSALVTDVGSTKRSIVADAERLLPNPTRFVGSHPMAGSEKRGVEHARADLYTGALCILTPTANTSSATIEAVDAFWKVLGMRTCQMSPEEHDRRLADVSHLPHALAVALVAMQDPTSIALAGKGFMDMTRIAGGDGALWRDILADNRDNVRNSVRTLIGLLNHIDRLLETGDNEALRVWLDAVAQQRQQIVLKRATLSPE